MAYDHRQVDQKKLQKVAIDGFSILDKHYGRGSLHRHTPATASATRKAPQDKYHYQKLAPNQYYYEESDDQAYVTAKEPAFRNYRPKQCNEAWYFFTGPPSSDDRRKCD